MTKQTVIVLVASLLLLTAWTLFLANTERTAVERSSDANNALKLYWFIPDGLRADPGTFTLYEWANQGLLPNIKKLMEARKHRH